MVMVSGEQVLPCPTCQRPTPHRPTPPDGWLRCRVCVPDATSMPVRVVNMYRGRSLFWHWIVPIIAIGIAAFIAQSR